ncbi:hypothetical protein QN277_014309 [Acacia crassicarpa]|uniref:Uncharacterized protein n=1 Tax=Acacia crassicarpa TaxID=499986 RepID=A0AAE1IL47_9FABA|nr:hypothetical protein QN277_014309 [Acacia crassicarpa]
MTRQKIEIKKIDNITARQVTFSKRRRGLFKKARELSTLCDAEIALIVFSSTGKLFDYASSSVQQVIERRGTLPETERLDHPSIEYDRDTLSMLSKEEANKVRELRQLNGEELEGLNTNELQKLGEQLEKGLRRVSKAKDELMFKGLDELKRKRTQLMEENKRLKQVMRNVAQEQGQSSESANIGSIFDPPLEDDSSDTSLRLGLSLFK